MNKNIIIVIVGAVLLVGAGWYLLVRDKGESYQQTAEERHNPHAIPGQREIFYNPEIDLRFTYFGGPDGYTLIESVPGQFEDKDILKTLVLVRTARYIEQQHGQLSEGIPAISVVVYEKPEELAPAADGATGTPEEPDLTNEQELRAWAETHASVTGIDRALIGPEMREVDGIPALYFRGDGLYASEVYILERRGRHYVLSGQFIEEGDDISQAYAAFLESVTFD